MSLRSTLIFLVLIGLLGLAASGCGPAGAGRTNVLLVSIDTLRADHVGAYGAPSARTPTLDALSAAGVSFERAISPTPITLPSHATLLTALDPPRHGVRHNGIHRLTDEVETVAERVGAAGWATGAVVGSLMLAAERLVAVPDGSPTLADGLRSRSIAPVARMPELSWGPLSDPGNSASMFHRLDE